MTDTQFRPTRRTLVRGAAWSLPVVSIAAAAPAFAASPIPCPAIPLSGSWSKTTISGSVATKDDDNDWLTAENKWSVWQDSATGGAATFTTTSPSIAVTSKATYQGTLDYWFQYGNQTRNASSTGTFTMLVNGLTVLTLSRQGTAGTWSSQPFSYTVPDGTTSVTITYRYVVAARGNLAASDDLLVSTPRFGTCTRN